MNRLLKYLVGQPIWVYVGLLMFILFGLSSLSSLKTSFFAPVDRRMIHIAVAYPGASPAEIEEAIVQKVEENLKGISGIDRITSNSREHSGLVMIEVKEGADSGAVLENVKNAVAQTSGFPGGMEPPSVYDLPIKDFAIRLAFYGNVSLEKLKEMVKRVEQDLLSVEGISQIAISGFPEQEIQVAFSRTAMDQYGVSFSEVAQQIRAQNIDMSGGILKNNQEEFRLRTEAKHNKIAHLKQLPITLPQTNHVIRLGDMAEIKLGWEDNPNRVYYNGKPAVSMTILKTLDEDIMFITDEVKVTIATFNQEHSNIKAAVTRDGSMVLNQRIRLLTKNGLIGFILVLLLLTALLNSRLSFWVALGIPVSFLGLFIVGNIAGMTINVISLFGMLTVIGILVDDAIVVGENVFSHFERGETARDAAINGTLEVLPSVLSGVLTTIVAFVPFYFLSGRIADVLSNMAFVVIVTLLVSLIECLLFLPVHLAYSKGLQRKVQVSRLKQRILTIFDRTKNGYSKILKKALKNKRITLLIPMGLFVMTLLGFKMGVIQFTFFPHIDSDSIEIKLTMPAGTRADKTTKMAQMIRKKVLQVNEELKAQRKDGRDVVLNTVIEITNRGSKSSLKLNLLDGETRNMETTQITEAIRQKVGRIPEAKSIEFGSRIYFGKPVAIALKSRDFEALKQAGDRLKKALKKHPDLRDILDSTEFGSKEIMIKLKPFAYQAGFNEQQVMQYIRDRYFGKEVQQFQVGGDEIKLWIRMTPDQRLFVSELKTLTIPNKGGDQFAIESIATISIQEGVAVIKHLNGFRQVTFQADLKSAKQPVPKVVADIQERILTPLLKDFPSIAYSFEGQKRQTQKTAQSSRKVIPLMLIVMFMVITLCFQSFFQTALVFSLIPFGIIGVAWGHKLHGMPINMLSIFGILALIGIMVNDSIVLVNRFNRNIQHGKRFYDAVYEAAVSRYRPIVLTSLTTIAGLGPLIAERSKQAQFLVPMAISVTYGLLFATSLILVILPLLLVGCNTIRRIAAARSFHRNKWPISERVEPAYKRRGMQ